MMMEQKKSFPETVAEELIEQLKAGAAPWQKPRSSGIPTTLPTNPVTGKRYRGINAIHLLAQSRGDPRWMTYNQAKSQGAQVRKGETGTRIQFWQFHEERDNGERVKLERPRILSAVVFNADQIDGLPEVKPTLPDWNPAERAENILAASGANIKGGSHAYYQPDTDSIHLPEKSQFASVDAYYVAALHELGHWTGHESRLARDLAHPFGSEGYAKEELRAEITSMILGDELGIGHDPRQHAAYVASWIKILENDPLEIFRATADAEKINANVLNLEHVRALNIEQEQGGNTMKTETEAMSIGQLEQRMRDFDWSYNNSDDPQVYRNGAEKFKGIVGDLRKLAADDSTKAAALWDTYAAHARRPDFLPEKQQDVVAQASQEVNVSRSPEIERQYINVPLTEKDEAKELGARWDRKAQSWYIPPGVDPDALAKWSAHTPVKQQEQKTGTVKPAQERVYLAVPYGERVAAKAAGAKWDKQAKSWYVGAKAGQSEKIERWLPESTPAQQGPAMTPREEFAEALVSLGCKVSGEHPIADGSRHRIGVEGDKPGEQAGFYVLHLDGHPAGYIKNNRTGIDMKWKSKGYVLDEKAKAQLNAEAATKLAERQAELEKAHEASAERVSKQVHNLVAVGEKKTPYLESKGIAAHSGIYTDKERKTTYVPAYDVDGKQWTMQYIQEDGTKRFAKDSRKEGCFHPIGGMNAIESAPVIVIAEGVATAASLSAAIGQGTVAAFDSGNLKAVAMALHAKYPDKPIIIAGDDDQHLLKTQGVNPGRGKATEAAKAVGGKAIFPVFAPGEQQGDPKAFTDFNDLTQKSVLGVEAVRRQVGAAIGVAQQRREEKVVEQIKIERKPEQKRRAAKVG
jgi:antirestriction protein ArdC/phage/plasmid primase-like uncharacterized protein